MCSALYGTEDPRKDPALAVSLAATATVRTVQDDANRGGRPVDEITISWTVDLRSLGLKCVWVGEGTPEAPQGGSIAVAVIPADYRSFTVRPQVSPDQVPLQVCYRLIPMSEKGAGTGSGVCATVTNARFPVIPGGVGDQAPGPPSVGTGPISDEGGRAWFVGFLVVVATIALVLLAKGRLRARRE